MQFYALLSKFRIIIITEKKNRICLRELSVGKLSHVDTTLTLPRNELLCQLFGGHR